MSTIIADNLTGKTSAGNITITAENNSDTYTLQQTVAKVTGNIEPDGSSNSAVSVNISSVTDGSTGLNTVAVTNAFSAALAVSALISNHDGSYNRGHTVDDASASSFITRSYTASGGVLYDSDVAHSIAFFGDLA